VGTSLQFKTPAGQSYFLFWRHVLPVMWCHVVSRPALHATADGYTHCHVSYVRCRLLCGHSEDPSGAVHVHLVIGALMT
jgi:hypothetical protein